LQEADGTQRQGCDGTGDQQGGADALARYDHRQRHDKRYGTNEETSDACGVTAASR
jgi:hypothetical protein